jgi:hypothetical protein
MNLLLISKRSFAAAFFRLQHLEFVRRENELSTPFVADL